MTCFVCGGPLPGRRTSFCSKRCEARAYESTRSIGSRFGLPTTIGGGLCELLAAVDLLKRGYHVFRSVTATSPFDIVACKGEQTLRVEVKMGQRTRRGEPTMPVVRNHGYTTLAVVYDDGVLYYGEQPDEATRAPLPFESYEALLD